MGALIRRCAQLCAQIALLFACNSASAYWLVAGADVTAEYSVSPQKACEFVGIARIGRVLPYRIAWLQDGGGLGGFYSVGFDVAGPALPNPENDYRPYSCSWPHCIIEEQYAHELFYRPDPSSITVRLDGPVEVRPSKTGGTSNIT